MNNCLNYRNDNNNLYDWCNDFIPTSNSCDNSIIQLNKKKYILYKETLYYKCKLLYNIKNNKNYNYYENMNKKYTIKRLNSENFIDFKIIFYKENKKNIKTLIFEDIENSEFLICFDCNENNNELFQDLNICKTDIDILEENFIINLNKQKFVSYSDKKISANYFTEFIESDLLICLFNKINQLQKLYKDNFTFSFTGYGKAGCYASLFSYLYFKNFKNDYGNVITFGMPRYGNIKYKEYYDNLHNIDHWNIINNRDLMSSIPLLDYKHVGNIFFLENNSVRTLNNYSLYGILLRLNILYCNNINDHNIINYINSIVFNNDLISNLNNKKNNYIKPYFIFDIDNSKENLLEDGIYTNNYNYKNKELIKYYTT